MANVTAGLVLAAGAGTRIGQPKASILVNGERLVDRAVKLLNESGCDYVFVVLGAWIGQVNNSEIVINKDWAEGVSTSIKSGLKALQNQNKKLEAKKENQITHVLITLVDLPWLTAEIVKKVLDNPADLVVAKFEGVQGHPVKVASRYWDEVMSNVSGDKGAKAFLSSRTDVVEVAFEQKAGLDDVDQAQDLRQRPL